MVVVVVVVAFLFCFKLFWGGDREKTEEQCKLTQARIAVPCTYGIEPQSHRNTGWTHRDRTINSAI